jgi:hypothetical protein
LTEFTFEFIQRPTPPILSPSYWIFVELTLITNLLQKDVPFVFDDDSKEAFETLKKSLTTAPIVQPPDWNLPFEIMCDASDFAVGAVLGQCVDKKLNVIHYASKTLDAAQKNMLLLRKSFLLLFLHVISLDLIS